MSTPRGHTATERVAIARERVSAGLEFIGQVEPIYRTTESGAHPAG
jgi:hypothetical protein